MVPIVGRHAYSFSLWDKEQELREAQRNIQEKEAMLKANAEKMAQDKELIAALEARLAQKLS